jgi:hypothetical protein
LVLVYIQCPPPCVAGIIITTTIIIAVINEMTLLMRLFAMKDVFLLKIHPPAEKKN